MHRIDGPGATVGNKFTEGDPVSAVPATQVTDDWLNAVQEEITAVILSAGITLNKANNAQLLAAITQKITSAIPASPPDASTTVKGLIELATNAETQAGTDSSRAITPAGLSSRVGTESTAGILQLATQAEAIAGSSTTIAVTPAGLEAKIPLKSKCTAWVNFNGTGTVAIRDSYNCLSVTDNGTGDYTINWLNQTKSTYSFSTGTSLTGGASGVGLRIDVANAIYTATQLRLVNGAGTAAVADAAWASVQIFGGQ